MILKLCLVFYFFIFSYNEIYANNIEEPIYCKYSDAVVDPFCEYLKKTYNLHCYGNGGGFINNINNIQLYFSGTRNASVVEARSLIIECTEELLRRINEDVQVRPYLSHYPFTEQGLKLLISFEKKHGEIVDRDFIASVFTCNKMIYYNIYNREKDCLEDFYQEPYQKAVEIVAEAKALEKGRVVVQKEEMVQKKSSKIQALCQYIEDKFKKS